MGTKCVKWDVPTGSTYYSAFTPSTGHGYPILPQAVLSRRADRLCVVPAECVSPTLKSGQTCPAGRETVWMGIPED